MVSYPLQVFICMMPSKGEMNAWRKACLELRALHRGLRHNYLSPGIFGFFHVAIVSFSFLVPLAEVCSCPLELGEAPSSQTYFAWQYQMERRESLCQLLPTLASEAAGPAAALALLRGHSCIFQRPLGGLK